VSSSSGPKVLAPDDLKCRLVTCITFRNSSISWLILSCEICKWYLSCPASDAMVRSWTLANLTEVRFQLKSRWLEGAPEGKGCIEYARASKEGNNDRKAYHAHHVDTNVLQRCRANTHSHLAGVSGLHACLHSSCWATLQNWFWPKRSKNCVVQQTLILVVLLGGRIVLVHHCYLIMYQVLWKSIE